VLVNRAPDFFSLCPPLYH